MLRAHELRNVATLADPSTRLDLDGAIHGVGSSADRVGILDEFVEGSLHLRICRLLCDVLLEVSRVVKRSEEVALGRRRGVIGLMLLYT